MNAARDPYVDYLHGFFARWSPLYDLFAKPIGFAYAAAARAAGAAPGRTVLDLCTGTGELALRAARRGAIVTAVDFTTSMLARARVKCGPLGVRFVEMDARALGFEDRSFDVAVLSFALHDMPAAVRVAALAEAARVSREGVIVLDYEPPRARLAARVVVSQLMWFETAYLPGFVRTGGARAAIEAAGLEARRLGRPLPGLFALWRADRRLSGGSRAVPA